MSTDRAELIMGNADLLAGPAVVSRAIARMAGEIARALATTNPVVLCVMKGGLIFAGHLLTQLNFPMEIDYVHVTRYGEHTCGKTLNWAATPCTPLKDRIVLLVDDILDEGVTLAEIIKYCQQQGAEKVYTAVLVDKQHGRKCLELPTADFTGLYMQDRFLFGFGMDCQGYWRNANGIFAVRD